MIDALFKIILDSIEVTALVMLMMILVDIINVKVKGKLSFLLKKSQNWQQYYVSSFLGTVPGCLGSYAGVSLYIHGNISYGAIAGLMIATSGDEAFVMLAMFPKTAIILFVILFFIGIFSGKLIDYFVNKFNIPNCNGCETIQYHEEENSYIHYFKDHLWGHIIKEHIWKIFLWTFFAFIIIYLISNFWDIQKITAQYIWLILLISVLIGFIPESGPHLIFVTMFINGTIPFSILLASSIVQDGHGMLPMLSFSVKDSISIKIFNAIIGLIIGSILLLFGY